MRPTCLQSSAEVLHGSTIRCLPNQSEAVGTFRRHHPADSPPPMGHMREQRGLLHLLRCQWQRLSSTSWGASRCIPTPSPTDLPRVPLSQGKAMLVFHRGTQHEGWPGQTKEGEGASKTDVCVYNRKGRRIRKDQFLILHPSTATFTCINN